MISKVITGKTFYGTCRYICMDQKRALVLEAEGVRGHNYKLMAADFDMQRELRPTLGIAVFHGILSFYPGEKIEDIVMTEIAREYLQKLGITNTQYSITKHTDKNHSHLHIIANLVNNKGGVIKDSWIGLKGKKVAQELTRKYGLHEAVSKNLALTNLESLNEKEANKYIIYQAILETLPKCKSLEDLTEKLQQQNIETLYKYKGQTKELQGISFKTGEYKYKGSEIDRKFSINNLHRTIQQQTEKHLLRQHFSPKTKLQFDDNSENKKEQNRTANIVEQLLKPEEIYQQLPHEWSFEKKPKKKSRGLHL
ncbi:MAG: relaxase/mobilization nuclease domain-containing protein [Bacteroidota bacterium]|nr:relaxase/mobilization nuclease domain-containing protein [Bacteroidota bacterium]